MTIDRNHNERPSLWPERLHDYGWNHNGGRVT